jgi:hypothetical protein
MRVYGSDMKRWAALPQGIRWLAGAAIVILALAIMWALFVPLADWLAHHDVGSVKGSLHETALDNARGRFLTLGAGLFAAGALVFTARNFTVSRRTLELTEQGQVTDRYTKAIEQLGSDKLDVRIGGIYALERVARDSARDHRTVMEVLAAFIREHPHEQGATPAPATDALPTQIPEADALPTRTIRPDVQAAVTVIGRRIPRNDRERINLTGAILGGADLADANLGFARLTRADLHDANLIGANLTSARLDGADLGGADLSYADLYDANLSRANLSRTDFLWANLTGTFLVGADLSGARWPADAPVPEGWRQDPGSGRLKRASSGSGPTEAD